MAHLACRRKLHRPALIGRRMLAAVAAASISALLISACSERAPKPAPGATPDTNASSAPASPVPTEIAAPPGRAPSASNGAAAAEVSEDAAVLQARALSIPVDGILPAALRDTFGDGRTQGAHEALDIAAPMRTDVRAVEDGVVAKLFTSERGGLTVYQYDPTGRYAYYYAHLDSYAHGLHEGQRLRRCDRIGQVGVTGNAPIGAPHLHFAIFRLEAQPRWWKGAPVNPFPVLRGGTVTSQPCPPVSR